jgi:serine-type D-Ala-D-Ala carboxypeptidase/endopeptidase (penicillin-binding protein 4)
VACRTGPRAGPPRAPPAPRAPRGPPPRGGAAGPGRGRRAGGPPAAPVALGAVESAPLTELLAHVVRWSDNHLTDGIFRTLGADGGGTWAAAADATRAALGDLGLDWTGAVLADGSGLSRDDRLTASLLTRLDLEMSRSELAPVWRDLMAVAGASGTLRHRLRGSLADRRLHGKTGTLEDVRALTGSVTGPDGQRYHLTVIGNDLHGEDRFRLRLLADEIVLNLTEDLLGCTRTYDEEAYADGERPAYTVHCPS